MQQRRKIISLAVSLLLMIIGAVISLVSAAPTAAAAPTGFSLENLPFSGLVEPVAVEFASTGQVFVAERRGMIKVYDNLDAAASRATADLRTRVFNSGDRGLLGLALDPQYPARPYLWALYAKNADLGGAVPKYPTSADGDTDDCGDGAANDCRISGELTRLTIDPSTGVWTGAENVILSGWCQQFGSHSIGTVMFGTDGFLYVSAGDGGSYNSVDIGASGTAANRCGDPTNYGGALRAQSVRRPTGTAAVLNGAVLRLDPDTGNPASGNPFAGNADPIRQRVLAYGLRNPFRMTMRPGTNQIFVGDVGWSDYEEIDRVDVGTTAQNFGWPCYEGPGRQSGYDSTNVAICESLYDAGAAAVVQPQLSYNHGATLGGSTCDVGSSSVSALAFSDKATSYPAAYRGGLFFGDYSRQCLWYASMSGNTINTATVQTFQKGVFPADLKAGPNGDIYLVDIVEGVVKRIRYSAGGNTPPIAIARANPSSGSTPLTVQFDGSGSSDPDAGSSLSYAWDLDGDGDFDDSTAVSPTYTYTASGSVTVRLRVTDNLGASTVGSVTITPGSAAPVVKINSAASTTPWKVGDPLSFTVSATDAEDGTLPPSRITTKLVIKHCPGGANCHEHVQQTFAGVGSGSFNAPDHEYPSYLELQSSATDSSGITSNATLRLDPATVNLTINTQPSGLQAVVAGTTGTTPFTVPVIQKSVNTIAVASPQVSGSTYTFTSWSDGGAVSHDIVANASGTYTANFTETAPPATLSGLVASYSFNEGTGTTATDKSGQNNTGTLINGPVWTTAGKYGGALTFDGTNDRVDVPDAASLDMTAAVSLSAWVRPTSQKGWQEAVIKERPNKNLSYALYAGGQATGQPDATISDGTKDYAADASAALALNTWSHLAMTYDGTTIRLYVNGTQVSVTTQKATMATSTDPLRIGGNLGWGEFFAGQLDEVHVYNRALSAAEVAADGSGTADTQPPTTPTNLAATGGLDRVTLGWTASTDNVAIPTYEVHRSLVNGFNPGSATRIASGVTATNYVDAGRPAGTYYYRVIASDGTNLSSPSNQATGTVTGDTDAPSVPGNVKATAAGTTATVTWNASTDNVGTTGYQVLRTGSSGSTTFSVAAPTTSLADSGLAGGTYGYQVRALDAAGNLSAYSATSNVTVVTDTAPPTVSVTAPVTGAAVSGAVTLTADAADDIAVAGVQFKVDGVAVGVEDTTAPYSVAWSSGSVANGTHQVSATARDTAGKTTTSATVSVTVTNTSTEPSGLVGAWSFNEGSGTVAADRSGKGNNGTLDGGAGWVTTGRYGAAINLDGVDDSVIVPDADSLDLTSGMTLSAWVRPTAVKTWRSIVMKERPNGLTYGMYATNGATTAAALRPNGTISVSNTDRAINGTSALVVNAWTHVALTYDGTTMVIYVNGVKVASKAQTGAMPVSTGSLRIGGNSVWNEWFSGQLDEVRVYNRALTAAEILTVKDTPLG